MARTHQNADNHDGHACTQQEVPEIQALNLLRDAYNAAIGAWCLFDETADDRVITLVKTAHESVWRAYEALANETPRQDPQRADGDAMKKVTVKTLTEEQIHRLHEQARFRIERDLQIMQWCEKAMAAEFGGPYTPELVKLARGRVVEVLNTQEEE